MVALETYRDLSAGDPNEVQDAAFATIAEIFDDGVTLVFDGMEEATQKRYMTNSFVVFRVGDRVRIIKDSGTYVVEYPVGAPRKSFEADYAATADKAVNADRAESAESADSATAASRASSAQNLYSQGAVGGAKIWLRFANGKYYIGAESDSSYRQIYPST